MTKCDANIYFSWLKFLIKKAWSCDSLISMLDFTGPAGMSSILPPDQESATTPGSHQGTIFYSCHWLHVSVAEDFIIKFMGEMDIFKIEEKKSLIT